MTMTYVSYIDKASVHRNRYNDKELIMKELGYDTTTHQGHSKNFFHIKTFRTEDRRMTDLRDLEVFLRDMEFTKEYESFRIPKASGGYREIEAPSFELKEIQSQIVKLMQHKHKILPHSAAYAYTKGRCAYDALVHHQSNNARWFLKLDIKEFFPSISQEVLPRIRNVNPLHMLSRRAMERLIDVATNDQGVLPQGSPLSPLLSNLVMMEFDYELTKKLKNFNKKNYTYTRYADDLLITCAYDFQFQPIVDMIEELFVELDLPFVLKRSKLRYGSKSGRNWNLGLMYNQDQEITIGRKKKQALHSQVHDFISYYPHEHNEETRKQAQTILGNLAYLKMIEPDYYYKLLNKYQRKFGEDPLALIKEYTT